MTIAQPQRKNPALAGFFVSEVKSSETIMGEFIECEVSKKHRSFSTLHFCTIVSSFSAIPP